MYFKNYADNCCMKQYGKDEKQAQDLCFELTQNLPRRSVCQTSICAIRNIGHER